jgi:hypothetical protein
VLSVIVLTLVVICAPSLSDRSQIVAEAAAKSSNPGVIFMFGDRRDLHTDVITDRIYSDGWESYQDGIGGVVAHIFASGSGDATLNLSKARPNRTFNGNYTPDSLLSPPDAPSGVFADGWFINIHHVWQMAVGVSAVTDASFSTGAGDFRWCGDPPDPQWCQYDGTQNVSVTRVAFGNWIVTADPPDTELNVLLQPVRGGSRVAGLYRMPFQLEIECLNPQCQ